MKYVRLEQSKACSRCKQIKPHEAFNKKTSAKDGLNSACRNCANKMKRDISPEQRERKNAKNREYRANNPEAVKKTNREQYLNKREERIHSAYEWKVKNPEKVKVYVAKWKSQNKPLLAGYSNKRRAKKKDNKSFYISPKEYKALYKSSCFACGSNKAITIEHLISINRGGNDGIGNVVSLCKSCNSSKQEKYWMEWRVWRMKRGKPPLLAYARTTGASRSLP